MNCASIVSGQKKIYFEVITNLHSLVSVPYVNAVIFAKMRLLNIRRSNQYSPRVEVIDHSVTWNSIHKFKCRFKIDPKTNELKNCKIKFSVRMETRGGKSFHKIGYVNVNLSCFVTNGDVACHRRYILAGYNENRERQGNSLLLVSFTCQQVSGNTCFRVPQEDMSNCLISPVGEEAVNANCLPPVSSFFLGFSNGNPLHSTILFSSPSQAPIALPICSSSPSLRLQPALPLDDSEMSRFGESSLPASLKYHTKGDRLSAFSQYLSPSLREPQFSDLSLPEERVNRTSETFTPCLAVKCQLEPPNNGEPACRQANFGSNQNLCIEEPSLSVENDLVIAEATVDPSMPELQSATSTSSMTTALSPSTSDSSLISASHRELPRKHSPKTS